MPKKNGVAGIIQEIIEPPAVLGVLPAGGGGPLRSPVETVKLGGSEYVNPPGGRARWRSDALTTLRDMKRNVYLNLAPASNNIEDVWVPVEGRVVRLAGLENGDLLVDIDTSAHRLVLKPSDEFLEMAQLLVKSRDEGLRLLVTEDPASETIHDVRVVVDQAVEPVAVPVDLAKVARLGISQVTAAKADELFGLLDTRDCAPLPFSADCIPFNYPDDGCFARAHQMCDLLVEKDIVPGKIWAFGRLTVRTVNHPDCQVAWAWHVAPFVYVGGKRMTVLDPALFDKPVPVTTWLAALGDPSPRVRHTPAVVFFSTRLGQQREEQSLGTAGTETEDFLRIFRLKLRDRTPPYQPCVAD